MKEYCSLVINDLVYYYDKGYLLQVRKDNVYKIAIKKTIKFYQRVDSESISFEGPKTRTGMFHIDKVRYYPVVKYFIGDRFNHFIKANAIDFKKEEDIIKLFRYCNK
ncbi:hypothetical protein DC498_08315 [Terrimonas sp.]|uniref:hypothetical protein n=1 Tax=Terrimonas sp. TaxID=1914338 RepID=UPI000D522BB8|nr:hypothetical protein [Terrimonas sp.]PVD49978.1 hypothetical protein DC498_22470 [Terrimonas sp.]PVD52528.1 hypothetical protein DC498_08315 [Terrimonas sp.]